MTELEKVDLIGTWANLYVKAKKALAAWGAEWNSEKVGGKEWKEWVNLCQAMRELNKACEKNPFQN
jgi:hypothetical protein